MIICIDFDGTCVTHDYPDVGKDIGAVEVLHSLVKNGHELILFTMRSEGPLNDAVKWFEDNNIPLFGVNVNPTQHTWTKSPKAYGHLYIDDAALGTPLFESSLSRRPYVHWPVIKQLLTDKGLI